MKSNELFFPWSSRCVGCSRKSCETWQKEKKKLMDDQLNVSQVSGGAGASA